MSTQRNDDRSVTRTYRAAVKIGDDYITVEETITLPLDAAQDEVQKAVELGWTIYRAQREALDAQVAVLREAQGAPAPITVRDPDAPASDKQRNYIVTLQDQLAWSAEQLGHYAGEQQVDLVTITKGQASLFIDGLKKLADERGRYSAPQADAAAPAITDQQLRAVTKLAQERGLNADDESRRRYQVPAAELSSEQAATLLRELQRPVRATSRREPAL